MHRFSNKLFIIGFGIFISFNSTNSQTQSDFARSLMSERDYFRAISVYKELLFYSNNNDSSIYYTSQIGKAYRLSRKFDLSIQTFSGLMNNHRLDRVQSCNAYMNLGLNYIGNNVPDQSIQFFNEADEKDSSGLSKLFLGYISCEMEDWKTAREYFQAGLRQNPSFNIQLELSRLNQTIANAEKIPSRSPTLAATLSLILPGSGQLYSNHTFDALQAFSFVAMLSYVSYITYKYDEKFSSNRMLTGVSLSITALFYIANIYGAYQTAKYFNIRQKDIFLQDMRERIMNFDF